MSEVMDDIAYLSQEIGPRPAGTEEEQQASIYISDAFDERAGLKARIEDFSCNSNPEIINVVLCVLPILFSIAAMIKNIVVIPAILVGVLCALFYILEIIDKPLLSKAFARGVSQNVVAKYVPEGITAGGRKKVIIFASYDSGKVQSDLSSPNTIPALRRIGAAGVIAIPVIWILRAIMALGATGPALVAWNIVTVVALILACVPIIMFVLHQRAEYNEAANCNAASVAALIELADQIVHAQRVDEGVQFDRTVHGEEAAREEDLIPEGAEVVYDDLDEDFQPIEDSSDDAPEPIQAEMPVEREVIIETPAFEQIPEVSEQSEYVYFDEDYGWPQEYAFQSENDVAEAFETQNQSAAAGVPDWYVEAQKNANKAERTSAPVRRSRFASALDEAVATSQARMQAASAMEQTAPAVPEVLVEEASVQDPPSVEPEVEASVDSPSVEDSEPIEYAFIPHDDVELKPLVLSVSDLSVSEFVPYVVEQVEMDFEDEPAVEEVVEEAPIDSTDEQEEASIEEEIAAEASPAELIEESDRVVVDFPEEEASDPSSTTAMAPIDVSSLREKVRKNRAEKSKVAVDEAPKVADEEPFEEEVVPADSADVVLDLPSIDMHQPAPLANMTEDPSLSSQIPRINLDAFGVSTSGNAEPIDNKRAALRNVLPSMSGSITLEPSDEEHHAVSKTGSFAPVGLSGSIGPVGDELIKDVDPEDVYVDDADDSSYETEMTETGAYAGPGYMEMPESRLSRIFGRFGGKKKDREEGKSAQEWLDVKDDFNPTEAGAERGGWESFNEENRERYRTARGDENIFGGEDDDDWNGGAFSKVRAAASNITKRKSSAVDEVEEFETFEQEDFEEPVAERKRTAEVDPLFAIEISDEDLDQEIEMVEEFHSKNIDVEVWFVALGSECAANGGAKAFLEEHADELDGAMIINLEGLGAGEFAQIGAEGFDRVQSGVRVKRYVKKARAATGLPLVDEDITWKDSIVSLASKLGIHGLTLAGVENGKPAFYGQGDDVIENVSEGDLKRRIRFIRSMIEHM